MAKGILSPLLFRGPSFFLRYIFGRRFKQLTGVYYKLTTFGP